MAISATTQSIYRNLSLRFVHVDDLDMIVLDHQPHQWVLLRRDDEYFMEVTSSISYLPISVIVKLDSSQAVQISLLGKAACQEMAVQVADSWLGCDAISESDETAVYEAIHKWNLNGKMDKNMSTTDPVHVVLLGDSIFDNAIYVPVGLSVIQHLRQKLPSGWEATLLAVDGSITNDVVVHISHLPRSATHLVVSSGGNDALQHVAAMSEPVATIGQALMRMDEIRNEFQQEYRRMLQQVLRLKLPVAVCTVYNAVPGLLGMEKSALALFNEIILSEAFLARVPVIDLRLVCNEAVDYSEVSRIEPSHTGGEKISQAIVSLLETHDFSSRRSAVFS